ncbi:MAG: hypothetical protein M3Z16_10135 [Pseudomonadota bacterium]|nr:hypothetical protein [Pseudomonadota bacterium]
MGLLDILQQYAGNSPAPNAQATQHFDEVAREVPHQDLGQGLAAAFRSDSTPPFGQMVGNLFGNSNGQQQAGLLNQLIQSIGPGALSTLGGGILGRILGGAATGNATPTITPEQASQLSPADVGAIAAHAEKQDPTIVDRVGSFYAQHPTLVKTLGAVALSAIMGHLSSRR